MDLNSSESRNTQAGRSLTLPFPNFTPETRLLHSNLASCIKFAQHERAHGVCVELVSLCTVATVLGCPFTIAPTNDRRTTWVGGALKGACRPDF